MVRIEILTGPEAGRVVELPEGRHVVGRREGSALRLAEDSVSGRHLELVVQEGGVRFRDLGSTNGTWSGGMKVQEGEWFPGSELRLGACRLRLLAPDEAGGAEAGEEGLGAVPDAGIHRRAVEEALSARRRGLPFLLVLLVALALGGGALWWRLGGGSLDQEAPDRPGGGPAAARNAGPADLLEGRGRFASAEAPDWELPAGVAVAGGALENEADAPRTARLSARLPLADPGLRLRARAEGGVEALVEFGREGEEGILGRWWAGDLAAGEASLALPEDAAWFRLVLRLAPGARVAEVEALPGTGPAAQRVHETRQLSWAGANLLLRHRDGRPLLSVRGRGGVWETVPGGLRCTGAGNGAELVLEPADAVLEAGPALLLADGGPVAASPGVVVGGSPGVLLGDEALRLLVRFGTPAPLEVETGGGIRWRGRELHLSWDLGDAFARAARLARRLEDAARRGDDRDILETAAVLLREVPLEAERVARAVALRRDAVLRGRQELADIRKRLAEALFLRSSRDLEEVRRRAAALAERLPGTEVAREAASLAEDVAASLAAAREAEEAARLAYRRRLEAALAREYPLLAAWLRAQGGPGGGGNEEAGG